MKFSVVFHANNFRTNTSIMPIPLPSKSLSIFHLSSYESIGRNVRCDSKPTKCQCQDTAHTFLYSTDLDYFTLEMKSFLGRPLLITEYRTRIKTVRPVKPISTNTTCCNWFPIAPVFMSLELPTIQLHLERWSP
jgi:hypothetical protein